MCEIIVFENQDIYSTTANATIDQFLTTCSNYISSAWVRVEIGTWYISVADISGGDKPMIVLFVGPLTEDDRSRVRKTNFEATDA